MTNDGTQDPVPPPVLADPLAGLVTGVRYEPAPLRVRVTEPPMPDISAVREAMASVLDADSELVLDPIGPATAFFTDSAAETAADQPADKPGDKPADPPAPAQPAPEKPATPPVARVPVSQVPAQVPGSAGPRSAQASVRWPPPKVPTRGAVTRVRPPAIPAPRGSNTARALPPAITRGEDTRLIRLPRGFVRRRPKVPASAKGPSSAGSVTLIMVLLGVMIVIGLVALASLIGTIASVFD